jgi:POT family proton-dependent oligopeptide transporter
MSALVVRWTYYGTTNIFNNYIRAPLPKFSTTGAVVIAANRANGVAGALGKGQQISFAIRTVCPLRLFLEPFTKRFFLV